MRWFRAPLWFDNATATPIASCLCTYRLLTRIPHSNDCIPDAVLRRGWALNPVLKLHHGKSVTVLANLRGFALAKQLADPTNSSRARPRGR